MTETLVIPDVSVLNVKNVVPNSFNPNVMDDEKYGELVADFREKHFVEPIIVRPLDKDRYEIVDGFHRWKACKEAGMVMIKAQIRTMDDDQARVYCYRVNRVRGTIDPLKEAHFFGVELGKKLTHEQIAAKYGVSRQQVTERLKLLTIEEPELKAFQEAIKPVDNTEGDETANATRVARASASQLEVLASVPEPAREAFIQRIRAEVQDYDNSPTVGLLQNEANVVKADYEKLVELQKMVGAAKFKVCPTCGLAPNESGQNKNIVTCPSSHNWNIETGELTTWWGNPMPKPTATSTAPGTEPLDEEQVREGRTKSAVFRLKQDRKDVEKLLGERLRAKLPEFDTITAFSVVGRKGGKEFLMKLEVWSNYAHSYTEGHGEDTGMYFTLEDMPYKTGEKTKVDAGRADLIPKVQEFIGELLGEKKPAQEKPVVKAVQVNKHPQYKVEVEAAPPDCVAAKQGAVYLFNFDRQFGGSHGGGGPAKSKEEVLESWRSYKEYEQKDAAHPMDSKHAAPIARNTLLVLKVKGFTVEDFFPEEEGKTTKELQDDVIRELQRLNPGKLGPSEKAVDLLKEEEDPAADPEDGDDETAMGREEA